MKKVIIDVTAKVVYKWEVEVGEGEQRVDIQEKVEAYFENLTSSGLEGKHFHDTEVDYRETSKGGK